MIKQFVTQHCRELRQRDKTSRHVGQLVPLAPWQVENTERSTHEIHSIGKFVTVLSVQLVLAMFDAILRHYGETRETPSAHSAVTRIKLSIHHKLLCKCVHIFAFFLKKIGFSLAMLENVHKNQIMETQLSFYQRVLSHIEFYYEFKLI